MEYCNAKYGKEPDKLVILDDFTFEAVFYEYYRSSYDEVTEGFTLNDLSSDLDAIYAARKEKEAAKLKEVEERANSKRVQQERRDKEDRQRQYEKLKKEFEG